MFKGQNYLQPSEEEIKNRLADPGHCPNCKSFRPVPVSNPAIVQDRKENIQELHIDFFCPECRLKWTDVYALSSIR
jgi:hypothetical protein